MPLSIALCCGMKRILFTKKMFGMCFFDILLLYQVLLVSEWLLVSYMKASSHFLLWYKGHCLSTNCWIFEFLLWGFWCSVVVPSFVSVSVTVRVVYKNASPIVLCCGGHCLPPNSWIVVDVLFYQALLASVWLLASYMYIKTPLPVVLCLWYKSALFTNKLLEEYCAVIIVPSFGSVRVFVGELCGHYIFPLLFVVVRKVYCLSTSWCQLYLFTN